MESSFWGTEVAYKNGYAKALEHDALAEAVCHGLQKTSLFCDEKLYAACRGSGSCNKCQIIAYTISEKLRGKL